MFTQIHNHTHHHIIGKVFAFYSRDGITGIFWSGGRKHFYDPGYVLFIQFFFKDFVGLKLAPQMKNPFVFAQKPSFNPVMLSMLFLL